MMYLYTGDMNLIDPQVQGYIQARGWPTQSQEEILQYGIRLLGQHGHVFSNNELVLLGLRLAIRRAYNNGDVNAHLKVIITFYSKDYPKGVNVQVDKEGNLVNYYRGFFDTVADALIELL